MKGTVFKNEHPGLKGARKPALFRFPHRKTIPENNSTVLSRPHLTSMSPQRSALSEPPADALPQETSAAASGVTLQAADNPNTTARPPNQPKGSHPADSATQLSMVSPVYKKKQQPLRLVPKGGHMISKPAPLDLVEGILLNQDEQNDTIKSSDFNLFSPSQDVHTPVGKRGRLTASASSYTSSVAARFNKRAAYDNPLDKLDKAFSSAGAPLCSGGTTNQGHAIDSFHEEEEGVSNLFAIDALEQSICHSICRKEEAQDDNAELSNSLLYDATSDKANVVLTNDLLRSWIGLEDLDLVLSTELRFDAETLMGVDRLSVKLPKLTSLRLNRSNIPYLRLLGARYLALRHLWISNCHLKDLRGIGTCAPSLIELYASFNYIEDLSPLMDVAETLQVADFEGNKIAWSTPLSGVLRSLYNVTSLNLQGNPVENTSLENLLCSIPFSSEDDGDDSFADEKASTAVKPLDLFSGGGGVQTFRKWVHHHMPQLQLLDDAPAGGAASPGDRPLPSPHGTAGGGGGGRGGSGREEAPPSPESELLPPASSSSSSSRDLSNQANAADFVPERDRKRQSQVFMDPLDAALTEELALLQDCIRSTRFNDALEQAVEMQHRELYTRPSTSAAARPFFALSSCPGESASSRVISSRASGVQFRQAATAYGKKLPSRRLHEAAECAKTVNACSSLTTGDVFTGSAISSLRKRLYHRQHEQHQQQQLTSSSGSPERATEREGSSPPPSGAALGVGSGDAVATAADSETELFEFSFDEDESFFDCGAKDGRSSEHEWERLKYAELQLKHRCRPASTSAFFRSRLQEYSSEDVGAAAVQSACTRQLGKDFGEVAENASMRELLMREVARTRVQIAREGVKSVCDGQRVSTSGFLPMHCSGMNEHSFSSRIMSSKSRSDLDRPIESLVREGFTVNVLDLTTEESK